MLMAATVSSTNADAIEYNETPDLSEEMKEEPYSLMLRVGWTFSDNSKDLPSGEYALKIGNQSNIGGKFSNGLIDIKNQLHALKGEGELVINFTNGPSYRAKVIIDSLPNTQTAAGLARRLTNLGFYAGTDGTFNGRMAWAVRAFKRAKMNDFTRNKVEMENNTATKAFLTAVQKAFGVHPGDSVAGDLNLKASTASVEYCGMFGEHVFRRGSFEERGKPDDRDQGARTGIWGGVSAAKMRDQKIAGEYSLYLRAFDPNKESPFSNRVNLPQPIHMAQFVLFELGYWFVCGEANNWVQLDNTWTRNSFKPDGGFGRCTQWAVREFQCHAKFDHAAKEDVASTEKRYLPRLFKLSQNSPQVTGAARYPDDKPISGALNEDTRKALQAWADGVLRCPVIVYASNDIGLKAVVQGSDLSKLVKENIWFWDDHKETSHRMYSIDYSGYYTIPKSYSGEVTADPGGFKFPKPIVLGKYTKALQGGPVSAPPNSTWQSQDVEITPNNLIGRGGIDGIGLNDKELSTFKVIRTASRYECYGYFDCFNAYDDVTISFGPCHWTLASTTNAKQARELPAFLAYVKHAYPNTYQYFIGKFGLSPLRNWTGNDWNRPQTTEKGVIQGKGSYNDNITIQIEQTEKDKRGYQILCGSSGNANENTYCKGWHWFYRFQMACRTAKYLRKAMWDFTRFRIRDILETELELKILETDIKTGKVTKKAGKKIKIGKYVTSEKGVAMLLRWHIWRPGHIANPPIDKYEDGNYVGKEDNNYIFRIISEQIKEYGAEENLNDHQKQAREDAILLKIKDASLTVDTNKDGKPDNYGVRDLYMLDNVPQNRGKQDKVYQLDLGLNKKLSSEYGSFKLQPPEPPQKEELSKK
jgi:hypothetical protein